MRRWADKHAIRVGQGLKPGRQIGSVADNGLLSGRADAGCASRNDETGGDAHARLQRSSVRLLQLSDLLHDFQSGPHCALGCVLLRLWKAEIHDYAVTEVLRDKSIVFANHRHAGVPVLAQQTDQVLRIQLPAERGRSHEIYENDGELAALDRAGASWSTRLDLRRCDCR